MRFRYCPDCGSVLSARDLGDEINVPWCDRCCKPWFPIFPTAVIALVYNDRGEVLLLRQNYISTEFRNLVSGYMQPGEDAEACARREIKEETGLEVTDLRLVLTSWFDKKEMLMIGFFAKVNEGELKLSEEVDDAGWFPESEILSYVSTRRGSASRRLCEAFLRETRHKQRPNDDALFGARII
ncbi:MAG: NUDIX domain-containing protein [Muribaculaceae bacterium]|nr:NUDIX domain-containing protein [Muribaculaceae bacterium]